MTRKKGKSGVNQEGDKLEHKGYQYWNLISNICKNGKGRWKQNQIGLEGWCSVGTARGKMFGEGGWNKEGKRTNGRGEARRNMGEGRPEVDQW